MTNYVDRVPSDLGKVFFQVQQVGWGTRPVTFLTPRLLFLLELTDVTLAGEVRRVPQY